LSKEEHNKDGSKMANNPTNFTLSEDMIRYRAEQSSENVICDGNGYIGKGGFVVYEQQSCEGKEECIICIGEIVAIEDRRDISKKELSICKQLCGGGRNRLVLLRKMEEGCGTMRPDPVHYPTLVNV
jgi:hypothetical protein